MAKRRTVGSYLADLPAQADSTLAISDIVLPPSQPRRYFDRGKQKQLTQSLQKHGLLEPLLVRPIAPGKYELVAGERRYRAAIALGWNSVPAIVRELTDSEALTLALVENLEREDLNPIEETEGIIALLGLELKMDSGEIPTLLYRLRNQKSSVSDNVITNEYQQVESVFELVGMTWESFIANRLPLLKLPEEILEALRSGQIAYTKAKAIARVKEEGERQQLLEEAIAQNLSLSQIKERIRKQRDRTSSEPATPKKQWQALSGRIDRARLWEDAKTWRKVETLMRKLEALLPAEDGTPPTEESEEV